MKKLSKNKWKIPLYKVNNDSDEIAKIVKNVVESNTEVVERIKEGEDIIGRNDNFTKVNFDDSFPKFLLNNKSFYNDWLVL